jgi:hypothetical protein
VADSFQALAVLVQVLDPDTGEVLSEIDSVERGTVTLDSSAAIRGRCELEIIDDGTLGLIPETASDLLAPYGNELRIARGIRYPDGNAEVVSLGIFRIRTVDVAEDDQGVRITVTGLDRFSRFVDARFEGPYSIAAATNAITAIEDLATAAWPGVSTSLGTTTLTVSAIAEEGEDRGELMHRIATDIGQELYFDGDGTLTLSPAALPSDTPDWTLSEGENGLLISAARSWDAERIYNRVIASGEPIDDAAPVRGVATDDNPDSPTYYYGAFGPRPRFYVSQMITTEDQASDAAAAILSRALGSSQQVRFGSVVNPLMQPGEVVRITRERIGLSESHVIDQLVIPLSAEEQMTGSTRVVEVQGA